MEDGNEELPTLSGTKRFTVPTTLLVFSYCKYFPEIFDSYPSPNYDGSPRLRTQSLLGSGEDPCDKFRVVNASSVSSRGRSTRNVPWKLLVVLGVMDVGDEQ